MFSVSRVEQLLKGAGVQKAHQEVEAGIVVRDQRKERHFFLSHAGQIQFIRGGQSRNRGEVELLQPGCQSDLDGFQGLGRAGTIILVILHRDVIGRAHFQPVKQLIQRRLVGIIVLPYLTGPEHFHDHRKVFLILRRFVPKVEHQRQKEHGSRCIPERIIGLAAFWRGGLKEIRHHLLHVVVIFQIGEGIVTMTFLHVQKINDADFIALPFQQGAAVPEQLTLTVQNKI